MAIETVIGEDGVVHLPLDVREKLELAAGSIVELSMHGRTLMIRPKRDMEKFQAAMELYSGSLRDEFLADGFKNTDDYMRFIRGDDYSSR